MGYAIEYKTYYCYENDCKGREKHKGTPSKNSKPYD